MNEDSVESVTEQIERMTSQQSNFSSEELEESIDAPEGFLQQRTVNIKFKVDEKDEKKEAEPIQNRSPDIIEKNDFYKAIGK